MKIKIDKRLHEVWREAKKLKNKSREVVVPIGKWGYIYSNKRGKISLIKLINYFLDEKDIWEIYCIDGNLFDDVERFGSKKEAEKRIWELLKGD